MSSQQAIKREIKIMDANTCQQRALDKSREIDPDLGRVSRVRSGEYLILGQSDWYTVTVSRGGYACTCPGGQHGRPACWHRASTFRYRLAERARKALTPAPLAVAA